MAKPFIVVAGNIGVGKSTVTQRLADSLELQPYFERSEDNPFLERFYQDMPRWGFHSQLLYFTQGLTEHREILAHNQGAIQDRSIYEHFHVFARELGEQGILDGDEFATLERLCLAVEDILKPPDLLLYLTAPVEILLERINLRGRGMETTITPEYLQSLDRQYERFLAGWTHAPVLFLDTTEINLLDNTELDGVCEQIRRRIDC